MAQLRSLSASELDELAGEIEDASLTEHPDEDAESESCMGILESETVDYMDAEACRQEVEGPTACV